MFTIMVLNLHTRTLFPERLTDAESLTRRIMYYRERPSRYRITRYPAGWTGIRND